MMNKQQKIQIFTNYLNQKNDSYADNIKQELYFHFIELENDLDFLDNLNTEKCIITKVDFIVSKIILLEYKDGLENIIQAYMY